MKTVSSSVVSNSSEVARADSLLDHPTSGLVVLAGFAGGLVMFGLSVLGSMAG